LNQKLSDWASIADIVSGAAIVITLIILIVEVRGTTNAIQAQTISAQRDAESQRRSRVIENRGGITELILKGQAGESLGALEEFQLLIYYNDALDNFEWQFGEVIAGRLPENQISTQNWRAIWSGEPGMVDAFERSKSERDPAFVEFWEQNVANGP